ncbi:MAG: hypothetical protein QME62_07070 [Armatimonadota bacterium]|nr:hypothetical protein [Armatimonadota bacterium]
MKIEEGQKKQLVILCCLIALVIGFGVYRVIGVGTQAAPPKVVQTTEVKEQAAEPEPKEAKVADAENSYVLAQFQAGEARDPFAPQALPKSKQQDLEESKKPQISANLPPLLGGSKPPIQVMPPLLINDNACGGMANAQTNEKSEQAEDPSQELKLTGVIEGSINVAIIRGPNNARYIVREGQIIEGKFNVVSISRAGVKIAYNGKTFFLRLGGNNANNKGAQA